MLYIEHVHSMLMHHVALTLSPLVAGLRYDDLYDQNFDMDVAEALKRLPQEVIDARNQRLKRAMDISMKHTSLPKDLQVRCLAALALYPETRIPPPTPVMHGLTY